MKWLFKVICFPLLHINNNVYTFLSGIAISLATNIFTTICIDDINFAVQWNLYVSTVAFAIVSALLLFMASKMSGFQGFAYNSPESYNKTWREDVLCDATKDDYKKWVVRFFLLLFSLIVGISFLATDFSWLYERICKTISAIGG